jgi:hypothetical protein
MKGYCGAGGQRSASLHVKVIVISVLTTITAFQNVAYSQTPPAQDDDAVKPGGFSMAVGPTNIRLAAPPGQTRTATVRVWNHGKEPMRVKSEINDLMNQLDDQGKLQRQFLPPGTTPFSCAQWMTVQEPEFVLPPEGSKEVSIMVSAPADVSGSKGAALFFRSLPTGDDDGSTEADKPRSKVTVQPRIGVLVFFDIEGTVNRQGQLLNLEYVPPTEGKPLLIRYQFENTGNADILVSGNFLIMDSNELMAARGEIDPVRIFPGDKGSSETSWLGLLKSGKYQLIITFELGPDAQQVIVKELSLDIP